MQQIQGWVENGNVIVNIAGTSYTSSTKVQGSFPGATVTIYLAGTLTLATIYADNALTVKANPFVSGGDGSWFFYTLGGRYDIKFSGGGITIPFTLGDFYVPFTADVTQFGAKGDGITDATAAIQSAISAVQTAGGGIVFFPDGTYITSGLSVTQSGVSFQGSSDTGTILKINIGTPGNYALTVDLSAGGVSRPLSFRMENFTIQGDSTTLRTYSGIQLSNIYKPYLNNIQFTALNICVDGKACFYGNFSSFWFASYNVGIQGDSGANAMNANTFLDMQFIEGNNDGTAVPLGTNLGNNTFINLAIGSSVSLTNASSNSGTDTTFISLRLETITSTSDWMVVADRCCFINPVLVSQVALATGKFVLRVTGTGNRFESVKSQSLNRMIRFDSTAHNNEVWMDPDFPTAGGNPVLDLGTFNTTHFGGDHAQGNSLGSSGVTWSDFPVTNLITRSVDMANMVADGTVLAATAADTGPLSRGGVFLLNLNTPSGNRQLTQTIGANNANDCYVMSFWAKAVSGGETSTVLAVLSPNPTADYPGSTVTITSAQWVRVAVIAKLTQGNANNYFAIQLPIGSPGIYIYGPQVVFLGNDANSGEFPPFFAGGYVPTYTVTRNDASPRDPWRFQLAAPTNGTWFQGDRVVNLTCSTSNGSPGFVCTAGGTPGTWATEASLGSAQVLDGGVFTPTLANTLNVTSSTPNQSMWTRIGNQVTVTGSITVTATAASVTEVDMTLPVASALAATSDLNGVTASVNIASLCGGILGVIATGKARLQWIALDTFARQMMFSFTYVVK